MSNIAGLLEKYKKVPGERFFNDIFVGEEYKAIKDIRAGVVLDIGACAGEFSAYVYDNADSIYALEPASEHFRELEENIKEFDLVKIKPFKIALSNYNGKGHLLKNNGRGSYALRGTEGEEVKVYTLASFIKELGITHTDILKIDIEDAEKEVFTSEDFTEVAKSIDLIIGEHLSQVAAQLESLGFKMNTDHNNLIFTR